MFETMLSQHKVAILGKLRETDDGYTVEALSVELDLVPNAVIVALRQLIKEGSAITKDNGVTTYYYVPTLSLIEGFIDECYIIHGYNEEVKNIALMAEKFAELGDIEITYALAQLIDEMSYLDLSSAQTFFEDLTTFVEDRITKYYKQRGLSA